MVIKKPTKKNSLAIAIITTIGSGFIFANNYLDKMQAQHDVTMKKSIQDKLHQNEFERYFSDWQDKQDCLNKSQDSAIKLKTSKCK